MAQTRSHIIPPVMAVLLTALLALSAVSLPAQQPAATDLLTNGDVNQDGTFDTFDIVQLERMVSLGQQASMDQLTSADVDGNGRLDPFDLLTLKAALERVNQGTPMFDAVKESIEADLSKAEDNVEVYLDLARFYNKEQMNQRSRSVLESVLEALATDHPLYNAVVSELNEVRQAQMREIEEAEDFLNRDPREAAGGLAGKTSLRRQVMQLKSNLSQLMDDQQFSAHYNSKRVKSQLSDVMNDMLRTVGQDQMVDPQMFEEFNSEVSGVLTNPENLVRQLDQQQRAKINEVVDSATTNMREQAVKLRTDYLSGGGRTSDTAGGGGDGAVAGAILNRDTDRLEANMRGENMEAQGRVPANPPELTPDTISIVAPQYNLSWDVSNVLGAKNASLEISKANTKFSNPRGLKPDEENTLYYTPFLGSIQGERRGSALELEGVGTYFYRTAALNANGEMISRFSEAVPLVVVYNNLDIAANKPEVTPSEVGPENPQYTFQWDVSNVEGARDAAVEISRPGSRFANPNGRARDRANSFFFNPSLGRTNGTFTSSINGLDGPGTYLFRVIAVSPNQDLMGRWSDPDTLVVRAAGDSERPTPVGGDQQQPTPADIPPSPTVESAEDGFRVSWNIQDRPGAGGVNLEVARVRTDTATGAKSVEKIIINQMLDSTAGDLRIESGLLNVDGEYQAKVAVLDSAGNLISSWSEPARFQVGEKDEVADTAAQAEQVAQQDIPAAEDTTTADTAAQQQPPAQVTPEGREYEVTSNNTPLYENSEPSSQEIASLQKGEKLIHVQSEGLWHRVYYPMGGKYGWVLSFNVQPSGGGGQTEGQ